MFALDYFVFRRVLFRIMFSSQLFRYAPYPYRLPPPHFSLTHRGHPSVRQNPKRVQLYPRCVR